MWFIFKIKYYLTVKRTEIHTHAITWMHHKNNHKRCIQSEAEFHVFYASILIKCPEYYICCCQRLVKGVVGNDH